MVRKVLHESNRNFVFDSFGTRPPSHSKIEHPSFSMNMFFLLQPTSLWSLRHCRLPCLQLQRAWLRCQCRSERDTDYEITGPSNWAFSRCARDCWDDLAALGVLEQEAGVQATAVQSAQRSLNLSTTRYEGDVTSYLDVITAQERRAVG
jgi:hypothetical protein